MNVPLQSLAMILLASQPAAALANDPSATAAVPVVQVNGTQGDAAARREFVAGKIIIGRKRIEESGVRKVEDMLRREPAVTVSGDGRIGLLNMPGYTQILLDGQPPVGRSPTEIDLVQVEKIEIIKSSMAEYGPFGVAGTINIITRRTKRKTETELVSGLDSTGGLPTVTMDLSRNSSTEGSPFRYSFQISAEAGSAPDQSDIRESASVPGQTEQMRWQGRSEATARQRELSGTFDAIWQRSIGETVTVSPSFSVNRNRQTGREIRRSQTDTDFDTSLDRSRLAMLRVPMQWNVKLSEGSEIDVSILSALFRFKTDSSGIDAPLGSPPVQHADLSDRRGVSNNIDISYQKRLSNGHNLKVGSTIREIKQEIEHRYDHDGSSAIAFDLLGTSSDWRNRSLRVFLQDEWEVSDKVSVNAGLSGQATNLKGNENAYEARNDSRLLAPSLHLSRKVGKEGANLIRLSIARSFKEVEEANLSSHPEIHPRSPCVSAASCGSNSAETADKVGNRELRPERALGINASYEHAIGDGSHVNVEIFSRQIDEKMGQEIILLTVPWSADPRYVMRPVNLGSARSSGISVEMELSLRDISATAPKVALRGSAAVADSRVENVPGPENKLDRQTPWNAKLGTSYTMQNFPLTFDADATWTPSVWIRRSAAERIFISRVFSVDASAKWQLAPDRRLVLSWSLASPRTRRSVNEFISSAERVSLFEDARRFSTVRVQFETSL